MDTGAAAGVSFVIPVFNKRPFVAGMVAGLAGQHGDFPREFIFIDDGSTDGSGDLIGELTRTWPDARLIRQPNRGPSIATNVGIAAARYPLIKPVDADDILLPHATTLLSGAMARHPEAALAFGATESVAAPTAVLSRRRDEGASEAASAVAFDALPSLLRNCSLGPSACLLRADTVRRAGGCDERVFIQDYSLFLRLAAAGAFVRVAAAAALQPEAAPGRLNDGGPQVLHDLNLALYHFLSEHRVASAQARASVRRGIARAWHWARRREGRGFCNPMLWPLLRAAAVPCVQLGLLRQSCTAFTLSRPVRLTAG